MVLIITATTARTPCARREPTTRSRSHDISCLVGICVVLARSKQKLAISPFNLRQIIVQVIPFDWFKKEY